LNFIGFWVVRSGSGVIEIKEGVADLHKRSDGEVK